MNVTDTTTHDLDAESDAWRWSAVQQRDHAHDGRFVYAVLTTGVYCRPSCPSRLALRENVSFFGRNLSRRRVMRSVGGPR